MSAKSTKNSEEKKDQPTSVKLPTGAEMPLLGLGTWKAPDAEVTAAVKKAIELGYTHIDGASTYQNEPAVGKGIKEGLAATGKKREDLFLTSKLWNTHHHPDDVEGACRRTLKDLDVEYLDMYLMHFPISLKDKPEKSYTLPAGKAGEAYAPDWNGFEPANVPLTDTWKAMEKLVDLGLVKAIGLSNFSAPLIKEIQKIAKHPVSNLQIEIHPYLSNRKMIKFCNINNISVTAYSSFGPASFLNLFSWAKDLQSVFTHPKIVPIAKAHNKSAAQVVLRWQVQQGVIVIPKSTKEERLKQNMALFDFTLTDEEMEVLWSLNENIRFNDPGNYGPKDAKKYIPIFD